MGYQSQKRRRKKYTLMKRLSSGRSSLRVTRAVTRMESGLVGRSTPWCGSKTSTLKAKMLRCFSAADLGVECALLAPVTASSWASVTRRRDRRVEIPKKSVLDMVGYLI